MQRALTFLAFMAIYALVFAFVWIYSEMNWANHPPWKLFAIIFVVFLVSGAIATWRSGQEKPKTRLVSDLPANLLQVVAGRFALSGLAFFLTSRVTFGPLDDFMALVVSALTFFVGVLWTGGALRLDTLSRIGLALTVTIGVFISMMSLVGTQAMSGNESVIVLLGFFALCFFPNLLGAAVGLLPVARINFEVYKKGVFGFCLGAVIVIAFATTEMAMNLHLLDFYSGILLAVVPGFVGCIALARALQRMVDSQVDNRSL